MRFFRRLLFTVVFATVSAFSFSQDADSLILSEVQADLSFEDSLGIFQLIDSLLAQGTVTGSQFAVRLSYNSNVLSTGRTLGIKNFGLSPGLSYYHKSGMYADLSGYWSKDFDPSYYLTVTSLGYMHDFSKHFSIIAGYDHYFYVAGENNYIPFSNAFSLTPAIELKPIIFTTTYSFYFGDARAYRIMPSINVLLEKKKLFGLDRVTISPSFYLLLGDETFIEYDEIAPATRAEAVQNFKKYGTLYRPVKTQKNVFGIMNYAVSLPINISHRNWSFLFSYAYSIPRPLPGVPLAISESSYLSASITRFLPRKRNKLAL